MLDLLYQPWAWYVAGPIIGLTVPLLLLAGGKMFGVSANLRHACAACNFGNVEFFNYDWKSAGKWNLTFLAGSVLGGFLGGYVFANPEPIQLAASTITDLQALGIQDFNGLVPDDLFEWSVLGSGTGLTVLVLGGFLVGFGARPCLYSAVFSSDLGQDMQADAHPVMLYQDFQIYSLHH